MRAVGLVCLLSGAIVLMLPTISDLLNRSFHIENREIVGGALLCLGVAAIALARRQET